MRSSYINAYSLQNEYVMGSFLHLNTNHKFNRGNEMKPTGLSLLLIFMSSKQSQAAEEFAAPVLQIRKDASFTLHGDEYISKLA